METESRQVVNLELEVWREIRSDIKGYGVSLGDDKNILKLDGAKKCSVRNRGKSIKERDTVL